MGTDGPAEEASHDQHLLLLLLTMMMLPIGCLTLLT
jgi:hypothetical protein